MVKPGLTSEKAKWSDCTDKDNQDKMHIVGRRILRDPMVSVTNVTYVVIKLMTIKRKLLEWLKQRKRYVL